MSDRISDKRPSRIDNPPLFTTPTLTNLRPDTRMSDLQEIRYYYNSIEEWEQSQKQLRE